MELPNFECPWHCWKAPKATTFVRSFLGQVWNVIIDDEGSRRAPEKEQQVMFGMAGKSWIASPTFQKRGGQSDKLSVDELFNQTSGED